MEKAWDGEAWMLSAQKTVGLEIPAVWWPEVRRYFVLSETMAAVVATYDSEIGDDLAPVFIP